MRTIGFVGLGFNFTYCPRCRRVWYQLEECQCDKEGEEIADILREGIEAGRKD